MELDCVVTNNKDFYPVKLMGVDPKSESKVVSIQNFMSAPLSELYSDNDEIKAIIGANLAKKLKVNVGDELKAFGVKPGSEASSESALTLSQIYHQGCRSFKDRRRA